MRDHRSSTPWQSPPITLPSPSLRSHSAAGLVPPGRAVIEQACHAFAALNEVDPAAEPARAALLLEMRALQRTSSA
jgi:hypothetical protein